MPLITKGDLDRLVGNVSLKSQSGMIRRAETDNSKRYDIFLSHSYLDKDTIFQINDLLEDKFGLSVYVDWIENPSLDRTGVTPATAAHLRSAMDRSRSLVYAVSANASDSKWMPWELGYSDARHGLVAVLPIAGHGATLTAYQGQEFVGLYPYMDMTGASSADRTLWINGPMLPAGCSRLSHWLANPPARR